jgi:hypothetical protein
MTKPLIRFLSFLSFLLISLAGSAQPSAAPQMDAALQQNGKIYVVVAVLVVIFLGIILFLIRMERRLHKLEKHDHSASS